MVNLHGYSLNSVTQIFICCHNPLGLAYKPSRRYSMVMNSKSTITKAKLLCAASSVIEVCGYEGLTLEAVAHHAGVSKGGLLYHYPSKESLVAALISSQIEIFERRLQYYLEREDLTPGRWTRAYVKASLMPVGEEQQSQNFGLIAAVAMNPELLAPLRAKYAEWQDNLNNDSLPKPAAQSIRCAVDGIWLCSMLGLGAPTAAETNHMAQWLIAATKVSV
jgi:AcrR family transcriptional regulator